MADDVTQGSERSQQLSSELAALAAERGLSVACAESLTAGALASRLGAAEGSADWFRGGVVSYAPEVKFSVLGVPEGPVVSDRAAASMATGVRDLLGADVGLGVTGVAGPTSLEGHPPGTVHLGAVVGDGEPVTARLRLPGDRLRVRQFACISLLDMLRRML